MRCACVRQWPAATGRRRPQVNAAAPTLLARRGFLAARIAFIPPHLDAAWRALRTLGDHDFQNAIPAMRLDAFRIGAVRQREAAMEAAIAALDTRIPIGVLGAFAAALALDGEDALLHRHFDVAGVDAGEIGEQHETVLVLADVDMRHPLAGHHRAFIAFAAIELGALDEPVERLPELILQRTMTGPLTVTNDIHRIHSGSVSFSDDGSRRPARTGPCAPSFQAP